MNLTESKSPTPASTSAMQILHPYTVSYLDSEFNPYHYVCYAYDEEHARLSALEMVQHIHDHPESIKWIVKENTDFDW